MDLVKPVAVHVLRSSSGIDSLDARLTGKRFQVVESGIDADGDEYLLLGPDSILAYVDQLDFYYLDSSSTPR